MKKIYSLLCLLMLFLAGIGNVQAVTLTLGQVLKADEISAGKKIVLRGLKNNNPWINIVANNSMTVSAASVFVVESADGGYYLKNESTGQYLMAYSSGSAIGVTTDQAQAGIFTVSNPTFNDESDMNWLEGNQDHSLLTRFTSKGTSMFINTQGATAKAIYAAGTGGWSIMYVYDVTDVDWNAPDEGESAFFEGDADKTYIINSMNGANAFIAETQDGKLSTAVKSNQNQIFWKLLPTENEGCYYVQNATTGKYIQSSKQTNSSQIPLGDSPVEFQIGRDLNQGATTYGYFYFCSTDQQNIPTGAIGLNYDSNVTKNVVAWSAKSGDKNSYWNIREAEYTYEPFLVPMVSTVEELDDASWVSLPFAEGGYLVAGEVGIAEGNSNAANSAAWTFVGTSYSLEGVLMVNMSVPGKALKYTEDGQYSFVAYDEATRWFVEAQENGAFKFLPFSMKDEKTGYIAVGEKSVLSLGSYRYAYASAIQVYNLPCGTASNAYLSALNIAGDNVIKQLNYSATAKPSSYYTIYTTVKPVVAAGTFDLTLSTQATTADDQCFAYFDWDRDGVYEVSQELETGVAINRVEVPADAKLGKSRMRIRITDNALTGAEDDVVGRIYDFILYVENNKENRTISVKPNATDRGEAYALYENEQFGKVDVPVGKEVVAVAEPANTLEFLCWKDGRVVVSTEEEYSFQVTQDMDLIACFAPYATFDDVTGIDEPVQQQKFVYELQQNQRTLNVVTDASVKAVLVYSVDGVLVKKSSEKSVSLNGLPLGTYIVKVIATSGNGSEKIALN